MLKTTSPTKSPRNSQTITQYFETPLFQLAEMKTARAVDRIFTQNSIEKVNEIFLQIQEDKRYNTNKLRSTLQKNYDKMLDCSELLERVEEYGKKIREIAQEISQHIVEEDQEEAEHKKKNEKRYKIKFNVKKNKEMVEENKQGLYILKIEEKLKRNEIYEALREIAQFQRNYYSRISKSEFQYFSYLLTESILKLEKYINTQRLTIKNLNSSIKTISLFLELENKENNMTELLNKLQEKYQHSSITSLFNIIIKQLYSKIGEMKNQKVETIYQQVAYQSIFDYKLSILVKQCKQNQIHSFENYFQDLLLIFQQTQKGFKKNEENPLCKIMIDKLPQIKADLAKIFIVKSDKGQITFKSQLYDKLMSSHPFAKTLSSLQAVISSNIRIQDQTSLQFFKELWKNYFIVLIDYCMQQMDPTSSVRLLIEYQKENQLGGQIPPEIQIYLIDKSAEKSSKILQNYIDGLNLAGTNLIFALKRSNSDEKELMKQKIEGKIHNLAQEIEKLTNICSMKAENSKISKNNLRAFLLLRIQCNYLHEKLNEINKFCVVCENIDNVKVKNCSESLISFFMMFSSPSCSFLHKTTIFEKHMNDFDAFFMGYIENVSKKQRKTVKKLLSEALLDILISLNSIYDQDSKQAQILQHTCKSLQQKKELMSIMNHIVLPYCAKNIFDCQFKAFTIDQNIHNRYFKAFENPYEVPSSKKDQQNNYEGEDDFEIGDKEEVQEVVKVNNNKKSLLNIGNNFIYGFMPKKK